MDTSTLLSIVQTVGFPAVCVLGMAYYVKYITDQHHDELNALNEQNRQSMAEVTEALNNNTIALQKLTDYIEIGGNDVTRH